MDRLVVGHGGVAICRDCARLAVELSNEDDVQWAGDLLLTDIGLLVTNDGRRDGLLGMVADAAVAVRHGRITWVGAEADLPARYRDLPAIGCDARTVVPGFVDAHRHVDSIPGEDLDTATERVVASVGAALEQGVTTVEARSWRASAAEEEITVLSALQAAGGALPADIVAAMGAGIDPLGRGTEYLRLVTDIVIPAAATVAPYLDVVVGSAWSDEEATAVVGAGRRHGMRPRVHVDGPEALAVALDTRAVSVEGMTGMEEAAAAVSEAGVVAVSVPVSSWTGGRSDAGSALWDAGAVVALGTGCGDGGVPTMPLAMAIAVHHGGVTPDQALWSATRGGALALEEPEKGTVRLGAVADLVVLEVETASELVAEPGRDPVHRVIKDGSPVGG